MVDFAYVKNSVFSAVALFSTKKRVRIPFIIVILCLVFSLVNLNPLLYPLPMY